MDVGSIWIDIIDNSTHSTIFVGTSEGVTEAYQCGAETTTPAINK